MDVVEHVGVVVDVVAHVGFVALVDLYGAAILPTYSDRFPQKPPRKRILLPLKRDEEPLKSFLFAHAGVVDDIVVPDCDRGTLELCLGHVCGC